MREHHDNWTGKLTGYDFTDATPAAIGREHAVYAIEVSIRYSDYNPMRKGLYAHVTPVTLEKMENGVIMKSVTLMAGTSESGFKMFILPMPRRNAKRMLAAAQEMDGIAEKVCEAFRKGDYPAANALIRAQFPLTPLVPA